MKKFYDREDELETLKTLGKGTNLVVIHGRKRVGKTRLVLEHLKGRAHIYIFVPKDVGTGRFLDDLSRTHEIPRFTTMKDTMWYVLDKYDNIFFDEFQNFGQLDRGMFSYFQEMIDRLDHSGRDVNIFVAGSSHSMMTEIFSDYASPLYGRTKASMNLRPLPLGASMNLLTDIGINSLEQQINYYSVFGGVPKYYEYLKTGEDFDKAIRRLLFTETAPLREEGRIVLSSEFGGEFRTYLSVLEAIASGNVTLNDISSALDRSTTTTSKYLNTLRKEHGIVKRKTPITEEPDESRRGVYLVSDNFLQFWLRFLKSYESYYEQGHSELAYVNFKRDFVHHVSSVFENIVSVILRSRYPMVGSWWNRVGDEIDIVAMDDRKKEVLFGEVKWRNRKCGVDVLFELQNKSELVDLRGYQKKGYLLVSKSGFTKKCLDVAKKDKISLWSLKDIEARVRRV